LLKRFVEAIYYGQLMHNARFKRTSFQCRNTYVIFVSLL